MIQISPMIFVSSLNGNSSPIQDLLSLIKQAFSLSSRPTCHSNLFFKVVLQLKSKDSLNKEFSLAENCR